MRIFTLVIVLFLLSAFAVGVSMQDSDITIIDSALDNITKTWDTTSLNLYDETGDKYTDGMMYVIFEASDLFVITGSQVMRLGILFGYENPDYFTPEYILKIIKILVILIIVSLLIKPLFYLGAFMVIFIMWLLERIKNRKDKKELRELRDEKQ